MFGHKERNGTINARDCFRFTQKAQPVRNNEAIFEKTPLQVFLVAGAFLLDQFAIGFTGKQKCRQGGTVSGSDLMTQRRTSAESPSRYRTLCRLRFIPHTRLQTAKNFSCQELPEFRQLPVAAHINQSIGDKMITQSKMPTVLAAGDKIKYKKSLAKMMVYWIINTRSEWLERLLTGQDDYWKTDLPHLAGAFTSDQERNDFLARVRQTVGGEVMKLALNTMNMHSMKEWVQMDIDPFCPADEAIDLMYKAFADCVNSLPEQ